MLFDFFKDPDAVIIQDHRCVETVLLYSYPDQRSLRMIYGIVHHFSKRIIPDITNIVRKLLHIPADVVPKNPVFIRTFQFAAAEKLFVFLRLKPVLGSLFL